MNLSARHRPAAHRCRPPLASVRFLRALSPPRLGGHAHIYALAACILVLLWFLPGSVLWVFFSSSQRASTPARLFSVLVPRLPPFCCRHSVPCTQFPGCPRCILGAEPHGDMEPLRRRCMVFLRSQGAHRNQVCCCPLSSHSITPLPIFL